MDKQPTEARQDELAGIKKKIAKKIPRACQDSQPACKYYEYSKCEKYDEIDCRYQQEIADQILSLTVSSGGICPECKGAGEFTWNPIKYDYPTTTCPACNGTGRTKVVEKTLAQCIEEATKDVGT